MIFDAPVDEGQSRWVIDAAKAKYPGKPIKQLVLTHHHMDHSGGTRAYVAEGAEIVLPGQARPFVEKMIQAEHKLSPDALARQPKPAKIVDVKDTMSLKDDTVEINLYNIPNPHADGMIIGHVVGPNLVWVTDLISPRGPISRSPNTVAVGDALRKASISGSTIVGGHGTTAKQAEIEPALVANSTAVHHIAREGAPRQAGRRGVVNAPTASAEAGGGVLPRARLLRPVRAAWNPTSGRPAPLARVNGTFNMAFLLSRGDHGGAFPLIRSSTKARNIEVLVDPNHLPDRL